MNNIRKTSTAIAISLALSFGAVGCGGASQPTAAPSAAASTSALIHTVAEDKFLAAVVGAKVAGAGFAARTPESLLQLARLVGANFKDGLTEFQIEAIMAPGLIKTATETDIFAFIAVTVGELYPEYMPKLIDGTK